MATTDIRKACYKGQFNDDTILKFGTSDDVLMQWDGTNFIMSAAADDSLIEIGDSATTQLSFDLKWYANEASGASYLYADASANLIYTTGIDLQFKDDDFLVFGTGAGATGDVQIEWDTTGTDALRITATADDTPLEIGNGTNSFDVTIFGNTANDYLKWDASTSILSTEGASRVALNGVVASGVTDGSVLRMGTSGSPLVDDQAGAGFVVGYFDSGATSGWPAGLFINTNVTGAGGSFTALQGDAIVSAAKATCTGIESFFQFVSGGSVTGAARACQSTIDFGSYDLGSGGVYSAACFNIKGEGAAADIGTTQRVSCLELKTEGTFSSVSGENFNTKAAGYAIYFNGFTAASGVTNILSSTRLAELPAGTVGIRVGVGADGAAGDVYYVPLVPAAEWN